MNPNRPNYVSADSLFSRNVEVFHSSDYGHDLELDQDGGRSYGTGFYWWWCQPGCLPDSDPIGPFSTEDEALADSMPIILDAGCLG